MKPPRCCICDEWIGETGQLLEFAKTEKGLQWDKRRDQEIGFVGHPPYADYFCEKHLTLALRYVGLPLGKAIEKIHNDLRLQ
ncbi:MAG: hypothetical protein AAF518_12170 [Spirochaetota bacterium]